ncbi:14212_t:CDS:1, partial [Ambispora leptoticha]
MNFDPKFTRIVNTLFSTQQAHITASGKISEPFKVERGVRQGDPLSPLLYIIAFNSLLVALQQNIQGININNYVFKLAAYADDLTVRFSSTTDWDSFTNTINKYEKASNAK